MADGPAPLDRSCFESIRSVRHGNHFRDDQHPPRTVGGSSGRTSSPRPTTGWTFHSPEATTSAAAWAAWSLGPVSIFRNVSDALLYRRHEHHLLNEREECFLITVPELAEVRFEQDAKDVRCRPGAFLIERSHLPYEFSHRDPAALTIWRVVGGFALAAVIAVPLGVPAGAYWAAKQVANSFATQ
jgi:hypothetical protein